MNVVSEEQAKLAARAKAAEAFHGSPFRLHITRLAPEYIRRFCPPRADVLDVGCGSGRYALFFIEAGVGGSYLGIDINPRRWEKAIAPPSFSVRFREWDAHEVGELGESFDFVISLTAFEHFADDARVMRGVAKVLRTGAHALVVVPAKYSYPLYGKHGYRRYARRDVGELANQAGLEIVELRAVGGLAGWLFHFVWFFPAQALRAGAKAVFYAIFGFQRDRARRTWPRLARFLDRLGQHHLDWRWGRALHRAGLICSEKLDRFLPLFEVGYLAVLRRPQA
jgi:SAM-dependent methyltransferase